MNPYFISVSNLSRILFSPTQKVRYLAIISTAVLKATLEESSDKKQEKIFIAAGFVAREEAWTRFERAWRTRLDESGISYYKTSEWKNLDGEFAKLPGRFSADAVHNDLENIIQSSRLNAFALGIIMEDYRRVLSQNPFAKIFYEDDPTITAFYHLMYEMNRRVRRKAKGCSIAFIYDESSKSEKVCNAFNALRIVHPIAAKTLTTFAPLNDKIHPSLQATDLLADVAKNVFGEWLARSRPRYTPVPRGWEQRFDFTGRIDEPYMLHEISRNLASPRFKKGLLPVRPVGRRQRRRDKLKSYANAKSEAAQ